LAQRSSIAGCLSDGHCGIYFFETHEALTEFKESELAKTIPSAYEALDVRREIYDLIYSLRPERGPFACP